MVLHGVVEAGLVRGLHGDGDGGDEEVLPLLAPLVLLGLQRQLHQLRLLLLAGLGPGHEHALPTQSTVTPAATAAIPRASEAPDRLTSNRYMESWNLYAVSRGIYFIFI